MPYPARCAPERDHVPSQGSPAWVPCDDCEEHRCTIHGGHVADCECPPIEEWTCDPYVTGGD